MKKNNKRAILDKANRYIYLKGVSSDVILCRFSLVDDNAMEFIRSYLEQWANKPKLKKAK